MGGLLSGPKTPALPAPTPMPDPDDARLKLQKRRAASQQAQSGRAGTILADGGSADTLGG